MIAHAGGIDEIILGVGVVLLFLLFRSARAEGDPDAPREGPCLYCGHPLGPDTERCPECGFRARARTRQVVSHRRGAMRASDSDGPQVPGA